MGITSIEWTDRSVNPIRARDPKTGAVGHYCEMFSSGCAHCYASNLQKRFRMPKFPGKPRKPSTCVVENGVIKIHGLEVFLDESKLDEVLKRSTPTKWFWCDMTDLFGSWVPDEWIDKCVATMAIASHHTHQVLTKRPQRMAEYFSDVTKHERWSHWIAKSKRRPSWHGGITEEWFPGFARNIWLGTSVEDQRNADERIPHLLRCPASVRFLSCEPLLSALDLSRYLPGMWLCRTCGHWMFNRSSSAIDDNGSPQCTKCNSCHVELVELGWLIVGGESGHNARPMHPDWARSLRDQCQAASVPFFFKQWGELIPHCQAGDGQAGAMPKCNVVHFPSPNNPVKENTYYRIGKRHAGRLLDGREWNEFPRMEIHA